ncbi:HIT family protein, partial [Halonotius pteroides]
DDGGPIHAAVGSFADLDDGEIAGIASDIETQLG